MRYLPSIVLPSLAGSDGLQKRDAGTVELSVVLCSDEYIAQLNKEWRQVSGPTDVLSFPIGPALPGCPVHMLGDIIISVPTAQRQAQERGCALLARHLAAL